MRYKLFAKLSLHMIVLMFFTCRYGGGMSSAKAALESDTRVGFSL
jgi:enoyl-[acyl-carrier-protein] reductase (NADH)